MYKCDFCKHKVKKYQNYKLINGTATTYFTICKNCATEHRIEVNNV